MIRIALMMLVPLLAAGGGEPAVPNCDQYQDPMEYDACVAHVTELLMEQQQRPAPPQQLAYPNAPVETPTVIVVDGGSSVGEWAAMIAAASSLIVALGGAEVFRRRRRSHRQAP